MKKFILLTTSLLLASAPSFAQVNLGTSTSANNPQRTGDATTGLYSPAAGAVAVTSSGTEIVRVNGTGVGIGTTSPDALLSLGGQTGQMIDIVRTTAAGTGGYNFTIQAGGAVSGGSNLSGGTLTLSSGISTGNGNGFVVIQTYPGGSSGTADNVPMDALAFFGSGTAGINSVTSVVANSPPGTNQNGGTLILESGVSTGTGTSSMAFDVYGAGSSGSAQNNPTQAMTIASTGNVGIGSTSPASLLDVSGVTNSTALTLNRVAVPLAPGGRLTLSSSAPVMTADSTNATAIYYLPYIGETVPIYNGTNWIEQDIGSSGLTLTLNTTNMPNAEVFDIYVSMQSSSPTLCALYWGGTTSRSTTVGGKSGSQNASITMLNGIWTNNAAIAASNCYNNSTAYTISQNQGTYLGTIYTTAAGQTGVVFKPGAVSGGSANVVGLWNAYNRVKIASIERDSKSSWTYATNAWRASDNSTSNRVTWVDGLQQSFIKCSTKQYTSTNANGNQNQFGCDLDSTTASPGAISVALIGTSTFALDLYSQETFTPQLGLHYVQMVEEIVSGTGTMYGNTEQSLMWEGEY